MGRHSRRGPVAKGDAADTTAGGDGRAGPAQGPGQAPDASRGGRAGLPRTGRTGWPPPDGAQHRTPGPRPAPPEVTPPRGAPRPPGGRFPDGTPAHGAPRLPEGTPARGVPRPSANTPPHGFPQARGGHPEQREAGGGWGELRGSGGAALPRQRRAPGPRQEYLDVFGEGDVFAPGTPASADAADAYVSVADWSDGPAAGLRSDGVDEDHAEPTGPPATGKGAKGTNGTKGRTFTGIAAAAVTTVLAVVVAGQVADGQGGADTPSQSASDRSRDVRDSASRADGRALAPDPDTKLLTYGEKMGRTYPLGATLKGSGKFDAVPGIAEAPGPGQKFTYRVDVEQGLGLDAELFAEAVQKTLNDQRSWAHNGARTFERVYSGRPDFVITLASPGTTADWCAKSGLDTTVDNVSCDSAATERVMINAYRWAQGSRTYGDKIHAYRQMLINHEVGHRLGYGHVTCDKDGGLAPVMQQQTKFLDHDGIHCLPNPWPYPGR
ncbi:DUF3152 domain-containing protein [Streptomyces djakartensis]|uniref:DUF3152 domain-containing protein n=1 Tax=Streptomyces djakartensis TaxID=68193 RepID=A0ABQ3AIW9_9ACTN|nr:DUF3152 domain-containing protein [Streptomyces djakartensis]GGY52136.1 hypothetical protein GCM10010384_67440 [Streptomyces djakartensis]